MRISAEKFLKTLYVSAKIEKEKVFVYIAGFYIISFLT